MKPRVAPAHAPTINIPKLYDAPAKNPKNIPRMTHSVNITVLAHPGKKSGKRTPKNK